MPELYTRQEFVQKYLPYVKQVTAGTGILPGTLMAQAIIESQGKINGTYMVGGSTLSRKANNFFGIKAGPAWKGKIFNIDTGEYTPSGQYYTQKGAAFRSYDSVKDSISDYVNFLKTNSRYEKAGVFQAKTVLDQAVALKKAGYATALNYPSTINSVFEGIKKYASDISSEITETVKKNIGKTIAITLLVGLGITAIVMYSIKK